MADEIIIKERKGLPRTNQPVELPGKITWINQPNLITKMSYDYQIIQLKALIAVIEKLQDVISLSISKQNVNEQLSLFNDPDDGKLSFEIPLQNFGVTPSNYNKLKESLKKLATIPVEVDYEDPNTGQDFWHITGLLEAYLPKRFERNVRFKMSKDVANMLVDVGHGFTNFIKEVAFNATSKYTIRFYLLISQWKDRGGFSIKYENLRKWLKIGSAYADYNDFYKRVIRPAYEDLFERSDVWFEMAEVFHKGSKLPYKLNFKVVKGKTSLEEEQLLKTYRLSLDAILSSHLGLDANHCRNIIYLLTLDNYSLMVEKVAYLKDYLPGKKIKDVQKYCVQAFKRDFDLTLAGESLEEDM